MKLRVTRFSSQKNSTLGLLHDVSGGIKKFLCFTLEDEYRCLKKYSKTRIPAGKYQLVLYRFGNFHKNYSQKFPDIHKGILLVEDVPNFTGILIHIGNTHEDTAGCLLVGNSAIQNITHSGFVAKSTDAYKRIYPPIAAALVRGEKVEIEYVDADTAVEGADAE